MKKLIKKTDINEFEIAQIDNFLIAIKGHLPDENGYVKRQFSEMELWVKNKREKLTQIESF